MSSAILIFRIINQSTGQKNRAHFERFDVFVNLSEKRFDLIQIHLV